MTRGTVGVGLGLRWEFIEELEQQLPALPFLEVSPENYIGRGGKMTAAMKRLRAHYPMLSHGLSLSIGGHDPFDASFLRALRAFLDDVGATHHSDHLCFSSVEGRVLHDLLPIPFVRSEIARIADRIHEVEDAIGRPFAVENVSYYLHPGHAEMSEADFVAELVEYADCKLMLDVNNAYVNAKNFGHDVTAWLARMPFERVIQMHVAGHDWFDEDAYELCDESAPRRLIVDTHGNDVVPAVHALLEHVVGLVGPVPVVLERDQSIPELSSLLAEVSALQLRYDAGVAHYDLTRST